MKQNKKNIKNEIFWNVLILSLPFINKCIPVHIMSASHSETPQWYIPSSSWIVLKMVRLLKLLLLFISHLDLGKSCAYSGGLDFRTVTITFSVSPALCLYQWTCRGRTSVWGRLQMKVAGSPAWTVICETSASDITH